MSERKYSFFFHYNKPESQKAGKSKLSVHFRGVCYIVDNVVTMNVDYMETRHRKQQPRCVLAGKASRIQFVELTNFKEIVLFG